MGGNRPNAITRLAYLGHGLVVAGIIDYIDCMKSHNRVLPMKPEGWLINWLRAYPKSNFVVVGAKHAPTTTYASDFTDRYYIR